MFGFLKKKLSKVVDSITQKVEETPEIVEPVQEFTETQDVPEDSIETPEPQDVVQTPEVIETPKDVETDVPEVKGDVETEAVPDIDVPETRERTTENFDYTEDKIEDLKIMEPEPVVETENENVIENIEESNDDIHPVSEIIKSKPEIPIIERKNEVELSIEAEQKILDEPVVEEIQKFSEIKPEPVSKKEELQLSAEDEIEQIEIKSEPIPVEVVEPKKKSFFGKLTEGIVKKVVEKKLTEKDVSPILEELETSMIESDVAVEVADKVKNDLKNVLVDQPIRRGKEKDVVFDSLRNSLLNVLDVPNLDLDSAAKEKKPLLITFLGFNGAGKTTSLAKTASWLKGKGYTCVLAAADTFRAGAEEQLQIHADKIGFKVVKHKYGADPAAVIFDAVEHAKAKGIDFVLADTAGRAHTNNDLMDQMKKIIRVNKPDINILVIDSLIGNDAILQARMYNELGVDALVFTKVDVNEKGGAILSVTHELKKPILFLGLGQEYKDFQEFNSETFVNNLLN